MSLSINFISDWKLYYKQYNSFLHCWSVQTVQIEEPKRKKPLSLSTFQLDIICNDFAGVDMGQSRKLLVNNVYLIHPEFT